MFLNKSDKLAMVDFNGEKINYNTLVSKVKYLSENFIPKGNKETFGIIFMENRTEYIYTFYALWDSFNIPLTIDAMSIVNEIEYFLRDSGSRLIIVSNYTVEIVKQAKENLKLEDLVIINVDEIKIDLLEDDRVLNHPIDDDLAVMLYTSGTTGDPKGVMLTYNNIYSQIQAIRSLNVTKDYEQVLAVLPFHHILPLMSTNLYFLYHEHQFSIVFVEKLSSQCILKALAENDVTILSLVPRVYKMFYKSIKDTIDSKWITRSVFKLAKLVNNKKFSKILFKKVHEKFGGKVDFLISGGAKSDVEMIEFFNTLGFTYCEGYGLTETSPVIAGATPSNGGTLGTVGKPVFNIETKVVNEELWVKGPIVMKGYFNKPDKTKEVMTEDGWFKTGDLVSIDENKNITILGRKNAMIVLSNGKNIDPETLENKMLSHSNNLIKEVGIFGNNDKLCALVVVDKIELENSKNININAYVKDMIELYNGCVHNYEKILEYKITTEELPKTRIGKIRRFMLKDIFNGEVKAKEEQKYEEPEEKEYQILKNYLVKMKGETPHPDKNLEIDFGLDSLDQIEFITFIENSFSIKLSEEEFKKNITLRELSKYISEKSNVYTEVKSEWSDIINKVEKKKFRVGFFMFILKPVFWLLLKLYFRVSIKGSENIKDEQQIFIANHESFVDILALNLLLPVKISKKTYSLAINWYFKNAFMKFFSDNSNVILLDIDNNIKETIEQVASCLKSGNNVFIFPEGTRTKDGNIGKFKKIFAILAKEFNLPITCLKIDGAYEAYSRYDKIPKPNKISVKYLGQINPLDLDYNEIVEKAREMYLDDNEKNVK